jgi:hypothetical protein
MAIKYVSSLANGSGDGTSTSTPWTLAQISSGYAAADEIRIMADGVYALTAAVTLTLSSTVGSTLITGANASGVVDGTRPILRWVTNPGAATYAFNPSDQGHRFELLAFDGNNTANGKAITCTSGGNAEIYNCTFTGFTGTPAAIGGPSVTGSGCIELCTFDTITGILISTSGWTKRLTRSIIKNHSTNQAIGDDSIQQIDRNVFYNFSVSLTRTQSVSYPATFESNTFHTFSATPLYLFGDNAGQAIRNNIIWNVTGVGNRAIDNWPGLSQRRARIEANAIGGVASGNNYGTDIGRVISTIALTSDPCVNAAAGDFSLNNVPGAGANCRGSGLPGSIGASSSTTTSYMDIGAVQHQDTFVGEVAVTF